MRARVCLDVYVVVAIVFYVKFEVYAFNNSGQHGDQLHQQLVPLQDSRGSGSESINVDAMVPTFDSPMANVTVKEGNVAILPCSVKYLGRRQVVWTDQWSTLLTHEDRRIIDDERVSVERPFTKDWNLHIRNVKFKDQGLYNCQINTSPVKIKTVHLTVQVPAKIVEELSSQDKTPREGETVTLVCNVTGIPMPAVTWYRHVRGPDGEERQSEFCPGHDRVGVTGEVLIIHNISRYCGDEYECTAFNGVPPAISKKITVDVHFPPEVYLPNHRLGQVVGKETILECQITANPQANAKWLRPIELGQLEEIKTEAGKYRVEIYSADTDTSTVTLSLTILTVSEEDFGTYVCEASNVLGQDTESMILFDYSKYLRQKVTTTTEMTTPLLFMTSTGMEEPRRQFASHEGLQELSGQQIRIFTKGPPSQTGRSDSYPTGSLDVAEPVETAPSNAAVTRQLCTAVCFLLVIASRFASHMASGYSSHMREL